MKQLKLKNDSVIPLYHQLKEILKEEIESGKLRPGDAVDSEHVLMEKFQVSRNTVKKSLQDLVYEGILHRIQGKGTFVSYPEIEQSLFGFYSFSKVMKSKGIEPKDVILGIRTTPANVTISRFLDIDVGTPVIELQRLRCANEDPIMLETSYIPKDIAPDINTSLLEDCSLYDLFQERYNIIVVKAKEFFEPVIIKDNEAKYLETKTGYPALLLDRIAYDTNERIVEYCKSIVRGDKCRFYTELL